MKKKKKIKNVFKKQPSHIRAPVQGILGVDDNISLVFTSINAVLIHYWKKVFKMYSH